MQGSTPSSSVPSWNPWSWRRKMNDEYLEKEFNIHGYNYGERGHGVCIEHVPTGIRSRLIIGKTKLHQVKNILMEELISELKSREIVPQTPKIGTKKLGKPRWK
jgi:hypothetical protein